MANFVTVFQDNQSADLDGKWIKILEARNYGPEANITSQDLDAAIRNFKPSEGIPLGARQYSRPALLDVHARISQLRRSGDDLMGKLEDPSLAIEQYSAAGGHE